MSSLKVMPATVIVCEVMEERNHTKKYIKKRESFKDKKKMKGSVKNTCILTGHGNNCVKKIKYNTRVQFYNFLCLEEKK